MSGAYCVIMAGGKGERFWPVSSDANPKPILRFLGDKSLIQLTVERAEAFTDRDRIFVVVGESHAALAEEQLPSIRRENILVEPEGKDTAPCIGYAATCLAMIDESEAMVVLPADHYVPDVARFGRVIGGAVHFARTRKDLVTLGVVPSRPETGYGYIHAFRKDGDHEGIECYRVERFVEKPDLPDAVEYVASGQFHWNCGIFVWRVDVILEAFRTYMPDVSAGLAVLRKGLADGDPSVVGRVFEDFPRKSIDFAIMEKARNVLMVPADFVWDDVGAWSALLRTPGLDGRGNYVHGEAVLMDVNDSVVYADQTPVGVIGLSGIVVVATARGVLVAPAERAQEVREVARAMSDGEKKR